MWSPWRSLVKLRSTKQQDINRQSHPLGELTTLLQDIVLNDLLPLLIIGSIFLLLLPLENGGKLWPDIDHGKDKLVVQEFS